MEYLELCQRNIGLFTEYQQEQLRSATITVAGTKESCAIEAATLARLGVGTIRLITDEADQPCIDYLGKGKATLAQIITDINPFIMVETMQTAAGDVTAVINFLNGSHLFIDTTEDKNFSNKVAYAVASRELGLVNITTYLCGFGSLMLIFEPDGVTLEEFFQAPTNPNAWEMYQIPMGNLFGPNRNPDAHSTGAPALKGGLAATEAALILTGMRPNSAIEFAPRATYLNALQRSFKTYEIQITNPVRTAP